MNLKKSIRIALANNDKRQRWLAEATGLSEPTISNICSRNTTSIPALEAIAKAFDMPVSEFIALGED